MAEPMQKYQLFPSPVTKVKPNNNPFRSSMGRTGRHFQAISPIEEAKSPEEAQAVVIRVTEPVSPIQDPPAAVLARGKSRTPSPVSEVSRSHSPTSMKAIKSPCYPPPQPSQSSSPLPSPGFGRDEKTGSASTATVSGMRSMFPQYNHALPLNQQSYFPQGAAVARAPPMAMTRDEYSPRVVSPSPSDALLGGPKTAPSSVIDFPTDDLDGPQRQISSLTDLNLLWKATNGDGAGLPVDSFSLEMSRIAPAIFSFGLSSSQPFYTLKCYSTNELGITRYHPARPKKLPILLLALEDRARRSPPNDGLVSYIFPKLAATLAQNQAAELAQQYGLAPTDKDDMTREAVARAAAQEASHLFWNEAEQRYELFHPALTKAQAKPTAATENSRPELSIITQQPDAHAQPQSPPSLHITISQSTPSSPPVISITSPSSPSSPNPTSFSSSSHSTPNLSMHQPPTLRASTQALIQDHTPSHSPPLPATSSPTTSSLPLATLSLSTLRLTLHTTTISSLLPTSTTLYAIDSLVSALCAVAVADQRTNPWLDSLPVSPSRPVMVAGGGGGKRGAPSVAGSVATNATGFQGRVYATLAERLDAENEGREERELMGKIRWGSRGKSHRSHGNGNQSYDVEAGAGAAAGRSGRDSDSTLVVDPSSPNHNRKASTSAWKLLSLRSKGPSQKKTRKPKTRTVTIAEYDLEKWGTYQGGRRRGEPLPGPARAVLEALFFVLRVVVCLMVWLVEGVAWGVNRGVRGVTSERF